MKTSKLVLYPSKKQLLGKKQSRRDPDVAALVLAISNAEVLDMASYQIQSTSEEKLLWISMSKTKFYQCCECYVQQDADSAKIIAIA